MTNSEGYAHTSFINHSQLRELREGVVLTREQEQIYGEVALLFMRNGLGAEDALRIGFRAATTGGAEIAVTKSDQIERE